MVDDGDLRLETASEGYIPSGTSNDLLGFESGRTTFPLNNLLPLLREKDRKKKQSQSQASEIACLVVMDELDR